MEKKIELTRKQFIDISTDVAATLCADADKHGINGIMIALITSLYGSKLCSALFNEEKLEVEE